MALTQISHVGENDRMAECIDNCLEAAQACEWCADECIGMGEEMARCIRLCRDIAGLTTLHARFMARDSGYSSDLAETCTEACEECADECEHTITTTAKSVPKCCGSVPTPVETCIGIIPLRNTETDLTDPSSEYITQTANR